MKEKKLDRFVKIIKEIGERNKRTRISLDNFAIDSWKIKVGRKGTDLPESKDLVGNHLSLTDNLN